MRGYIVSASEYSNPIQGFGSTPGDLPQPPEWWRYKGEALVNTGITNTNGAVWGATLVSALAGTTPIITLTNTQYYDNNAASLNVQLTNVIKIVDANSGQDLTRQLNTMIVGQQMNLQCQLTITNFTATNLQWTVPGRTVKKYDQVLFYTEGIATTYATNADLQTSDLSSNLASFYWINSGTNLEVDCEATIDGKSVTSKAFFNVLRPASSLLK